MPTLRALADDLGTTVSLLVAEGDQQVAIAVVVPGHVSYQLSFHEGSRYPLDRGAAGIALLASMPAARGAGPGAADATTGLGAYLRGDRAEHLRPRRAGSSEPAVAADLYQPHLAPRRRGDARQGRSHQGCQRFIGNS
ncbi:putative regulatory protein [Mycobacterium xenopi 3993]|nr:putative regulatory protein [Mycobacterium xenopi 3993]